MDVLLVSSLVIRWLMEVPAAASRRAYAQDLGLARIVAAAGLCAEVAAMAEIRGIGLPVPCRPDRWQDDEATARCPNAPWLVWCARYDVDPLSSDLCTSEALFAWVREMDRCGPDMRGLSRATKQRRITAVRRFYRFVHSRHVLDCDPGRQLEARRQGASGRTHRAVGLALSVEQVAMLQAEADQVYAAATTPMGRLLAARTAALVAVLSCTGARIGEPLAANLGDYDPDPAGRLTLRRKGGRVDTVGLSELARKRVGTYQAYRHALGQAGGLSAPLFATHATRATRATRATGATRNAGAGRPGRWSASHVGLVLHRLCRGSPYVELRQVADQINARALRSATITHLLDDGVPIEAVQDLVGHASPTTTQVYDRARRMRKYNAVGRLADIRAAALDALPSSSAGSSLATGLGQPYDEYPEFIER